MPKKKPPRPIRIELLQRHETKSIVITRADVDVAIVPVIEWLNNMRGITTLFCCQGDDSKEGPNGSMRPYVMLRADFAADMYKLNERYRPMYGDLLVEFDYEWGIRYTLRFRNTKMLERFIKVVINK